MIVEANTTGFATVFIDDDRISAAGMETRRPASVVNLQLLFSLQKNDGVGGDPFFTSCESKALGGARFDVDLVAVDL